jgi:hypothetical protein
MGFLWNLAPVYAIIEVCLESSIVLVVCDCRKTGTRREKKGCVVRMNRGFMKRWAVFLVLIVGSAFLLGGCGSSGDDPGPTPAPTTSGVVSISGQVANSVPTEISVAATERLSAMKVSRIKSGSGLAGVDISAKMEGWELTLSMCRFRPREDDWSLPSPRTAVSPIRRR